MAESWIENSIHVNADVWEWILAKRIFENEIRNKGNIRLARWCNRKRIVRNYEILSSHFQPVFELKGEGEWYER